MQSKKYRSIAILFSVLVILLSAVDLLAQRSIAEGTPAKTEVYIVPFSHLDLFWAGTREECLARGNRIIAKAIRIAKQYSDFKFLVESDNFLADYVEAHAGTQELEDLKRLVKEGRIEIAPNWANIFLNLPDGEVHARNLLYGKLYARSVFGVDPPVMHTTDQPGFTPQYPQMLVKAGIPFMTMTRIGPTDKSLFNWRSPDQSKVLVWNAIKGYGWGVDLNLHGDLTDERIAKLRKDVDEARVISPGPIFVHWGVDLWAPSEKLAQNVGELNRLVPSAQIKLATSKDFFNVAAKTSEVPDVSGEVPSAWPHVVDSILHLWQWSVPATNTLTAAEEFATINYALGYADYPQQEFEVLWKRLIESMDHNHDGQGGEIGDNRKLEYSRLSIIRGGEILRDMLRNIAERVQIPVAKSVPIVVFNGLGWQRDDVVKAHLTIYGDVSPGAISDYKKGLRLIDETGKSVPFYVEQTSENISRAVDLIFIANGVPALGYKTYFLSPSEQSEPFPSASQITLDREKDLKEPRRPLGTDTIENQFYRVNVDKATGRVAVFDKQLNREVCKDLEILGEEERGTNNVQREIDTGRTIARSINETFVEENNAVRTVMRISGWVADIPVVQRLILYSGLKRLDIEDSLEWKEPRFLRIEQVFPLQQSNVQVHYGVPFGENSVTNLLPGAGPRAGDEIGKEAWAKYRQIQDWVFAGNSKWGLTLAADHQLVKIEDGLIRANMIRGQRYTSAKIVRGDEITSIHFPRPGHYIFRYSLSTAAGDWNAVHSYQAGLGFNNPLIPVSVSDEISTKSLPPTHSFCSIQGDNLVISALKKSEQDRSIILRLYEIQGAKAETPITFLGRQRDFSESDLLEQDLRSQRERVLRVNPYEIKTLKLQSVTK